MLAAIQSFWSGERGAASTRKGFVLAAAASVIAMSSYLMTPGTQSAPRAAPPSAEALALARLTEGQIRSFDEATVARRLAMFADPREFTEMQLRNAHRTWSRRALDGSYGQPDLAADMAAIAEAAMGLRGVRPHNGI